MRFFFLNKRARSRHEGPGDTDFISSAPFKVGGDAPKCNVCERFVGPLPWLPPYRVELDTYDRSFGDLVVGPSDDLLVSERFKVIVDSHNLVGLEGFDPVEVVRIKRHKRFRGDPPAYYRVTAKRTQAAIDTIASGFEWRDPEPICPGCRRAGRELLRWKRVIVEENTWTGEDIFVARGLTGAILTTERVKELVEAHHLLNFVFVPTESYAYDFSPQRSEADEQRVREILAMPLGPTVLQKVLRINGRTWKYCALTNELVVIGPDGKVVTYFKPDRGIEYFNLDI